jgi:branched-chain amino acid transport system permease protein
VIVGGLGSLWGALLGGFVLGLANVFGLQFDPNSGLLYTHLTFFVILMILPQGLSAWRR